MEAGSPADTAHRLSQYVAFEQAMNDDLGTPAAVAALFDAIRHGNQALNAGDEDSIVDHYFAVSTMLDIFGIHPHAEEWREDQQSDDLSPVVDKLVQALLAQRAEARANKDWGTADAIRDTLAEAGLTITDTPDGAKWSVN